MLIFTERRSCFQFGNAVGTCPWCRGVGKRDFGIKLFLGLPRGRVATPHSPSLKPAPAAIPEIIWEAGDFFFFFSDALSGLCVPTAFRSCSLRLSWGGGFSCQNNFLEMTESLLFRIPEVFKTHQRRGVFPALLILAKIQVAFVS